MFKILTLGTMVAYHFAALDIPDPSDTKDWRFQTYTSWDGPPYAEDLEDPVVRMKFVRERMAQFCEPFRTAFLAVDDNEVMPVYPWYVSGARALLSHS